MIELERKTIFSPCRRYRYTLWREWPTRCAKCEDMWPAGGLPCTCSTRPDEYVQFIGLNPSTADETQDDPTIRRCIGYAKTWGFGALCMTNLFAWRDTSPEKMKAQPLPIAEPDSFSDYFCSNRNDYWVARMANGAALIVAACGKDGAHLNRWNDVRRVLVYGLSLKIHCLGVNKDGTPKHPLYLPKDLSPMPYLKEPNETKMENAS